MPSSSLGKHFASSKKCWTSRAKQANNCQAEKNLFGSSSHGSMIKMSSTSTKRGMSAQEMAVQEQQETMPLLAPVGEQLYRLPTT